VPVVAVTPIQRLEICWNQPCGTEEFYTPAS
jgi:hypothetical protein